VIKVHGMKNILVTGGAGFIGSHLCTRLLADGNRVICLDNLFSTSKDKIASLSDNELFSFVEHDIIEPYHAEVDEIYNLACPASPVHYQVNPIKTIKTSVMGAIHVLGMAKKNGAKVLQASTSEVYGDPEVHPQTEDYWGNCNPIGVRSCYDEGKRCAESLFINYHKQNHTRIKIARIFNTYGPNMETNDGRVVSNFIVQALQNRSLTIYGNGSQSRSFQYVDDLIDALIQFMETPDEITGPMNLGNPREITMIELAEIILKLTGSQSKIVHLPLPVDDPVKRKPDIGRAKETLNGWEPQTELETGLAKTIEYFRQTLKNI
jgi:UDP-glucuronate decarboxylase